jgi:hypothetical protein
MVDAGDGLEQVIGLQPQAFLGLQLMCKHIEEHFGIGLGIDVAPILDEQLALELGRVDQVAVVGQRDPEGRVDVKRLRLGRTLGAGGQ